MYSPTTLEYLLGRRDVEIKVTPEEVVYKNGTKKLHPINSLPPDEIIWAYAMLEGEYSLGDINEIVPQITKSQVSRHNKWFVENGLSIKLRRGLFRKIRTRVSDWLKKEYIPHLKILESVPPK